MPFCDGLARQIVRLYDGFKTTAIEAIVKARLFGFEMRPGAGITVSDFMQHVLQTPIDEGVSDGNALLVYVQRKSHHYVGCVITTKDKRKFLEVMTTNGEVRMNPRDVTPGSRLAEFNFFALFPGTGRGVYLHYSDSCGLQRFAGALKRRYISLRQMSIDEALLPNTKGERQEPSKVRARFKGKLTVAYSFRTEDFDTIAAEFDRLQGVRFALTSLDTDESDFRQLASKATRRSKAYTFSKAAGGLMGPLLSQIKKIWLRDDVVDGTLTMVDPEGLLHSVALDKRNRTHFGEYDLDELMEQMGEFNPSKFDSNEFSDRLVATLQKHKHHFETAVKDEES